jgi:very-short-patch-repair endonuclease
VPEVAFTTIFAADGTGCGADSSVLGMDLTGPFRGSTAVAAGALGRGSVRGPRYRRLFPDVYVPAELEVDLALRSRAAYLLVEPDGVLSGYSAAELLGASCGPQDAPVELTYPRSRRRLPGLTMHRELLAADEIVVRGDLRLTTPLRTAFDLARRPSRVEAVAAVDALAHRFDFELDQLRTLRSRHLGLRGSCGLERVLELVDRRAQSPMESRIRVALVRGGLPPAVQHPVPVEHGCCYLDLAYPELRLGVEFDGRHHRTAEQARSDLHREALLTAAGWKIIRFDAWTVFNRPQRIVTDTRAELLRRGW